MNAHGRFALLATPAARIAAVARLRVASWLVLAALVAACGGSGSSGFDGEPASEAEAILLALEDQSCVEFEGVTYCASAADTTVGSETATVTIEDAMTPVACAELPDETECVASLGFEPSGFPAGTVFRAATASSVDGPWTLSADVPPPSSGGQGEDERDVDVQVPSPGASGPPAPLVLAVLVYVEPVSGELPSAAPRLSDFGADVVYVGELEIAAQ